MVAREILRGHPDGHVLVVAVELPTLSFQREKSKGLNATYHFVFTGDEPAEATMVIKDQKLTVSEGLIGDADLRIQADSAAWLKTPPRRFSTSCTIVVFPTPDGPVSAEIRPRNASRRSSTPVPCFTELYRTR